jgi:phage I-like protein
MCSASLDVGEGVDAPLPTEFRVFKAGENVTSKGVFIFDIQAALDVMAAYQAWGVDLMIDLNHDAVIDSAARSDASDARGWFKLELRGGDLYAVDVRWTPDGARRLREKTQRYISPYFGHDKEGRICEVINVAMVAMPATHDAPALVAAKRGERVSTGALAEVCKALLVRMVSQGIARN